MPSGMPHASRSQASASHARGAGGCQFARTKWAFATRRVDRAAIQGLSPDVAGAVPVLTREGPRDDTTVIARFGHAGEGPAAEPIEKPGAGAA